MNSTSRSVALCLLMLLVLVAGPLRADDVNSLARDVERLVSLREVKDLQRAYAHHALHGQWSRMASLFAPDAQFTFGRDSVTGRHAIESWLRQRAGGQGRLAPGALNAEFIDEPLVNLSADGSSARARWMGLAFRGDGRGGTRIEGGIYENQYRRTAQGWKISVSHYHAQYEGDYERGWANVGGGELPLVPYHFSVDESGVPIPAPAGAAPDSDESLPALAGRIERLNDEDAVRNLQHAYGYYVDRRMWDDVVDLFAEGARVRIGRDRFRDSTGVRQAMERMGPAGLVQGVLNDHPQFATMVQVLPDGRQAIARGIELGMIGDAARGTQHWQINVFRNRFVKHDGVWKLAELDVQPLLKADFAKGWGDASAMIAGRTPGFISPGARSTRGRPADAKVTLAEARRRLARSMAYDGTENVSAAYGYYIDDFQWPSMGAIFAVKGNKHSPFAGYYIGRDRISAAATAMYGNSVPARTGIAYHWRIQPVILVAEDGRSANLRTRLFEPVTGKTTERTTIFSGMYPNDQTVLEGGIWRLWALEIDEPYFTMAGWKGGWSGVKPKPPGSPRPPPSPLVQRLPPDIILTEMGERAGGFRGGTGETIEWPGILPMWFNYLNPVSGRRPQFYWPDCVPCVLRPESQMTRHGYLMPPAGPTGKAKP
jgi:SnoaL-like domain